MWINLIVLSFLITSKKIVQRYQITSSWRPIDIAISGDEFPRKSHFAATDNIEVLTEIQQKDKLKKFNHMVKLNIRLYKNMTRHIYVNRRACHFFDHAGTHETRKKSEILRNFRFIEFNWLGRYS